MMKKFRMPRMLNDDGRYCEVVPSSRIRQEFPVIVLRVHKRQERLVQIIHPLFGKCIAEVDDLKVQSYETK